MRKKTAIGGIPVGPTTSRPWTKKHIWGDHHETHFLRRAGAGGGGLGLWEWRGAHRRTPPGLPEPTSASMTISPISSWHSAYYHHVDFFFDDSICLEAASNDYTVTARVNFNKGAFTLTDISLSE